MTGAVAHERFRRHGRTTTSSRSRLESVTTRGRPTLRHGLTALICSCQVWSRSQPIRCRLITFLLVIRNVTLWPRHLTLWPSPLTLNICSVSPVTWCNSTKFEWNRAIRGGVISIWMFDRPYDLERVKLCCDIIFTKLNKKLIRRWDSERELSLRRHCTRTKNTIDSCINSATHRFLQHRFTKFSEITQCNGHYAVHGHSRSPILVPIESSYTTSY